MIIFYRISDNFQKTVNKNNDVITKEKPSYITKKNCFLNALDIFGSYEMYIIADNVRDETYEWLLKQTLDESRIFRTNIGNGAGTFNIALNIALNLHDDEGVYFLEDDYLHKKNANLVLEEGLNIGDYVTLYDHPDKYINGGETVNNCIGNPFIRDNSEISRVYLSNSCHWKLTNSTTMTFASKVKTLKKDIDILKLYTSSTFPYDFQMFQHLINENKRKLISSIPGYSTHGETAYLSPLTDWSVEV